MTKRFLTVAEFCSAYGTGRTKTYALLASGELTAVKRGRSTLISAESAERWAQSLPPMVSRTATSPDRARAPARASEAKS